MASSAVSGQLVHDEKQEVEADFLRLVPDLVVGEVLKSLDTASLLACRLLSRRMEELVRLPQVWAHRRVVSGTDLRAALLLAVPCVEELHVDFHRSAEVDAMLPHMNCVAEKLFLNFDQHFPGDTGLITTVLRNQAQSGRLKELTVLFVNWYGDAAVFCELARTIVSTSTSLKFLDVDIEFREGDYPIDELRSCCNLDFAPGLKTLRYSMEPYSSREDLDPLLEKLLVAHAATLENVLLEFTPLSYKMMFPKLKYPRLKRLVCPMMEGMENLAECNTLETLGLFCDEGYNQVPHGVERLLVSTHCTHLWLIFIADIEDDRHGLDLLKILARYGRGTVSKLTIDQTWPCREASPHHSGGICPLFWYNLAFALPGLIALKELHVDLGDTSVYDRQLLTTTIRPLITPLLRDLHLNFRWSRDPKCTHFWLHQSSVKGMLSRNPKLRLHVNVGVDCRTLYSSDDYCQFCRAGCHNVVSNSFTWMDFSFC